MKQQTLQRKTCAHTENTDQLVQFESRHSQFIITFYTPVVFLCDHWAHYGTFENGVLLMYTLEGVSNVANFISAYEESQ